MVTDLLAVHWLEAFDLDGDVWRAVCRCGRAFEHASDDVAGELFRIHLDVVPA